MKVCNYLLLAFLSARFKKLKQTTPNIYYNLLKIYHLHTDASTCSFEYGFSTLEMFSEATHGRVLSIFKVTALADIWGVNGLKPPQIPKGTWAPDRWVSPGPSVNYSAFVLRIQKDTVHHKSPLRYYPSHDSYCIHPNYIDLMLSMSSLSPKSLAVLYILLHFFQIKSLVR